MQGPKSSALSPNAPRSRSGPASEGRAARRAGWAAACAVACSGAWAQNDPNPYYIGITAGVARNTNINNVADGPGDTSYSTGLVAGVDQRIGRQRVYGSANVSYNRYNTFTQLDNTSYGLNLALDWQTVGDLSGSVSLGASQGLANLDNNLLEQTSGRNLVRTESIGTRANWGGNGTLTVGGGYGYSKTHYTQATLLAGDSNSQTADIGVYFHPGQTLALGTALRYTRSETDHAYVQSDGSYGSNTTNGRNIDLSVQWTPTALSSANARISWTNQSNSDGAQGYSGLTGGLGFTYAATGKLSFTGNYSRDAATNGTFYNTFTGSTTGQQTGGLASNNSVSNGFSVGANYSATAKVSVLANASYRRASQADGSGGNYRDAYTDYSLGARWAIRRFWTLGCNLSRAERRLTGTIADSYNGNIYSCSTQVTLQ